MSTIEDWLEECKKEETQYNIERLENLEKCINRIKDNLSTIMNQPIEKIDRKELEEIIKPSSENKIKVSFLLNGVFGVLRNYIILATGTSEENIKILTELTYSNVRHITR